MTFKDLPPLLPEAFELTLPQQLHVERVRRDVRYCTRPELEAIAVDAAILAERMRSVVRYLAAHPDGPVQTGAVQRPIPD